MHYLKQLAGQTALYGLGIVIPRLLSYVLLTPFYTRVFNQAEYGIITEFYAYVVILLVILTYGMETGFFRFADKEHNKDNVYKSVLIALGVSSGLFMTLAGLGSVSLANFLDYPTHPEYVWMVAGIVGLDAFTSIPFAKLRLENKALKYALIRISEILVNLFFNWFFLYYCQNNLDKEWINEIYDPEFRVSYVFLSNLFSVIIKSIFLYKEIFLVTGRFERKLVKEILIYSYPLLIAGLAGTINEVIDRVLLKYLLPENVNSLEQLGIYGASVKLAVLMTLFIQMFRYAAEPFFFSKKDQSNATEIYAQVMKYFIFIGMGIFLFVMLFIDTFILFIGNDFREGVSIIPVVLLANLFVGVFYNLSIWYKLSNKTAWGAYLVIAGAIITILINILFVPEYGYYASAWGRMVSYGAMVALSFIVGQRFYPVNYKIRDIIVFVGAGLLLYLANDLLKLDSNLLGTLIKIGSLGTYLLLFLIMERKVLFKKHETSKFY